jgi:serine/threonine protein kinase
MDEHTSEHPDSVRLAAFGRGILDHSEMAQVETHLAVCESCRQALSTLPDNKLAGLLLTRENRSGLATTPQSAAELTATVPRTLGVSDFSVPSSFGPLASGSSSNAASALAPETPSGFESPESSLERELAPQLVSHPRYRIVKRLGIGGMGSVYLAEHRLMDRPVALKVIRRDFLGNETLVERFRREVKAAARLALHPNIVAAYDAEQAGDSHFLVMEFVDGVDLARLVKSKGPLPFELACEAVKQAAEGLEHAWQSGMVHRDIKPQNLMRTPDGQVKILDFGLARFASEALPDLVPDGEQPTVPAGFVDAHVGGATLTLTDMVLGTADYIAPEQASNPRSADIRADIYSLGCTLYYLLAGYPPFPGGNLLEKLKAHSEQAPTPLAAVRPDLPAELARIVDRMMVKDRSLRFQRPAEVAEALGRLTISRAFQEATSNVGAGGMPEAITSPNLSSLGDGNRGQAQTQPLGSSRVRPRWPSMKVAVILVALLITGAATLGILADRVFTNHWLMSAYSWLYSELFSRFGFLLALVFIADLFRQRRSPGSRLAWILVLLLVPFAGVPLYLVLRSRKMRRRARRLVIHFLSCLRAPLYLVLGSRKMRRLARWKERHDRYYGKIS